MLNGLKDAKKQAQKLRKQMSLAQKVGQMTLADQSTCSPSDVKKYHLGAVMSAAGSSPANNSLEGWVDLIDGLWFASLEQDKDHLPIPILYGLDAVHGNNNVQGATIFPHNIGIGAAHSDDTVTDLARVSGDEVRAIGASWIFGPNVAVAKHYHWGRTYESISSQVDTVSHFAETYLQAINEGRDSYPILPCLKHWVGDGGTEHGIEQGNTNASLAELEKEHIAPFKAGIKQGALSIMVSFSSWNGQKCHANSFLINEILKRKLKFNGFVVSDMQGIDYLNEDLHYAIARSVNAGIDMFMVPDGWRTFQEILSYHVELGTVSEERINDAVERILTSKILINLFERESPSEISRNYQYSFGSENHRFMAQQAVSKSLVLLKNSSKTLPLQASQRILVTGRSADHAGNQCGGFTLDWQGMGQRVALPGVTTIWQGIKQQFSRAQLMNVDDFKSCEVGCDDTVIVVIGENPYAEGLGDIRENDKVIMDAGSQVEGTININPAYGKTLRLADLHPEDLQLLKSLKEINAKIITVLVCGRPLIVDQELELSDAFMVAWLPGSEGQGVAEVACGNEPVTGKLAFAWPTEKGSKATSYTDTKSPYDFRWPIGFGLSYSEVPGEIDYGLQQVAK